MAKRVPDPFPSASLPTFFRPRIPDQRNGDPEDPADKRFWAFSISRNSSPPRQLPDPGSSGSPFR